MKIGITGSNNTGKTTLGYRLTSALMDKGYKVDFAHESVKFCPKGTKGKTSVESQIWILGAQMQRENVIASDKDFIICDKTSIDTYAYGIWAFEQNPTDQNRLQLGVLEYMASKYLETYDKLILLPVLEEIPYHQWIDGIDHRKKIDELIRKILNKFKVEFNELKPNSKNERVKEVLIILKKKGFIK